MEKRKMQTPKLQGVSKVINPSVTVETPPREMGRDDRRIVFAKIDEVYLGEGNGYSQGWNDEAVAKDLAIPRAWVASVREEMFGPAISVEDPKQLKQDLDAVCHRFNGIDMDMKVERFALVEMREKLDGAIARIDALRADMDVILSHIGDIKKRAGNLEKLAGAK
jgi:hypothetical protein